MPSRPGCASVCRFDWSEFPGAASLSIDQRGARKRVRLKRAGETFDLSACTAGWLRRPRKPQLPERISDPLLRTYAEEECYQVVQDTWNALDIPLLPGPIHAIRSADNKQLQLQLATALGFDIPPTLITNDPDGSSCSRSGSPTGDAAHAWNGSGVPPSPRTCPPSPCETLSWTSSPPHV